MNDRHLNLCCISKFLAVLFVSPTVGAMAGGTCAPVSIVREAKAYNSWPMIQAVGGRICCAYSRGSAHTINEGERGVWAKVSEDGGTTWSEEVPVANDPRWGEVTIGKGADATGAMLLWVRCWGEGAHHDLYRSADGIRFEKIATPALDPLPMQITDIIRVPDVGLLCLWFSAAYRDGQDKSWGTLVSRDEGRTWTQRTIESGLKREDWPTEPSGVWLGNGRILVVARSEGTTKHQFQLVSSDSGKSWRKFRTNIIDVQESTPSLVYDDKTGTVYNYYYQRGARQLKRRLVKADFIFGHPDEWPEPEVLFEGREQRAYDAGNVNVTVLDGRHYAATYTGSTTDTAVLVVPVDPQTSAGRTSTTVVWDFPRTGSCHEGLPFADGRTGVLVWGGGDTVNLTVGRGDLWDHRGGYPWTEEQSYSNIVALVRARDVNALKSLFSVPVPKNWNPDGNPFTDRYNPYMLPLGRVVVRIPGAELRRGELDTSTGLGKLVLADGREIALAMSRDEHVFAMKMPDGLDYFPLVKPATDFPIYDEKLKGRGFKRAKRTSSLAFTWELPADKPVSLECENCPLQVQGRTLYVWTSRGEPSPRLRLRSMGFAGIAGSSEAHWRKFWQEGARVTVPDPAIQEIFDFGMYKFGSMTDPDGFPAGLQGQWLEDDRLVPWNGDYHFNINVQECYSPAFRGGHFRNLMPLFRMVLSWRDRLRDNAKKFVGIEDGYVLPHSVDDRGVCIGGFWAGTIDHASTAWVASLMYRYVRYSGDVAVLKDGAYDFMKGAMNVYRAMMEEKDGRLSISVGPSPEWGDSDVQKCVGRDPSFQLAAAHRLARDLIAAADRLGEAPDPMWLDVEKRLPPYTKGPGGFQLFEGQPFVESHRHHSHMAGLYPFDTIDFADKNAAGVVRETYRTWVCRGTGLWSGWCVPWASILHTHVGQPVAAVQTLRAWKAFYNNPGHGSLHDAFNEGFTVMSGRKTIMQMDGQCAAVTAVLELMAHEVNGTVEFFRGCPESWGVVSFENLALSDGTRVDGSRVNGRVSVKRR